jgi:hypothetical protein
MKPTDKPGSKISMPQPNTHHKSHSKGNESIDSGIALLKKNEFALIIAGALVVTVIVFFVFFRSSEPEPQALPDVAKTDIAGGSLVGLEKRIEEMASVLERLQADGADGSGRSTLSEKGVLEEKVQRLETALTVKFDSLTERMGRLEKQVNTLDQTFSVQPAPETAAAPATSPQKAPVQTLVKKQPVKSETKVSMFHTVQKGETLWSIAKKYKTSVANLRKLNKMSSDVTLYPGTNILVR